MQHNYKVWQELRTKKRKVHTLLLSRISCQGNNMYRIMVITIYSK